MTDKKVKKEMYLIEKLNRLLKEIQNNKSEIRYTLQDLAELNDNKVYQIYTTYNNVQFVDYVIAKSKEDALDKGLSFSEFYEVFDVFGDGEVDEELTEVLDID